jgi:hypothetical protein
MVKLSAFAIFFISVGNSAKISFLSEVHTVKISVCFQCINKTQNKIKIARSGLSKCWIELRHRFYNHCVCYHAQH